MNHILLPTDGSDTSFSAARLAFDLFGTKDVRYTLVHTYLKTAYRHPLVRTLDTGRVAVNKLRRFERRCRRHAPGVMLAKRHSPLQLVDVLNGLAGKGRGDLVVMGTQGEGNYGLVGRNTSAVVMGSDIPVIAVPSQWHPARITRIMLAIDGGPVTRSTVAPLIALARHINAEVVVAHVRDKAVGSDARIDRRALDALFADTPHSFVTVQGTSVVNELNDLAKQGRIQLVAVIHRRKSFWQRLFSGSKAKRMALHTITPLLVLPERA